MGMVATLEQITPLQLAEFLEQPKKAYDFRFENVLNNPELEPFLGLLSQRVQSLPPGFREQAERVTAQLQSKRQERKGLHLVPQNEAPSTPHAQRKQFSLEKDWHVLHYVLNGTAEGGDGPLSDSILGGEEIPDVEHMMSYGPIRYLSRDRVAAVASALANVNPEELTTKLNREDAEARHIYLAHTLPDGWEYLPDLFRRFRTFYEDAVRNGNAMLLDVG